MAFVNINEIEEVELVPGVMGRFVHSENMTLAYWTIREGALIPEHAHQHEQFANVIEGEFELTIEGETRELVSGMVAVIPPHALHGGKALTECKLLDVFYPVREDYR
jgi:quercetin dioxygenase-like cupin family protein